MKKLISIIFLVFFVSVGIAQNGINYKALIKDANGNVLASSPISVQFTIYEGAALTNNVYQESHTVNTDANGFVIVNIGDGATGDDFNIINWSNDQHFLNVQADIGSGLVDLGTTQFMAVPYALSAANVNGLETIDEGNGIGHRLIGKDVLNYGNIGEYAVDLSTSLEESEVHGATGRYSVCLGINNIASNLFATAIGFNSEASGNSSTAIGSFSNASGVGSVALGANTIAYGNRSTAMGRYTIANGWYSTAIGNRTTAYSFNETVIGAYNSYYSHNASQWDDNDRLFVIGNGTSDTNRNNALTVLKNGNIGVDIDTPQTKLHIIGGSDTGLGNNNGYLLIGSTATNNISIDNNEIMAKDNGNASDLNLQIEGGNVKIGGPLYIGDEVIQDAGNNALRINAALLPDFDDTNVLGNSSQRWRTLYAVNGTINTSDRREKKNIEDLNYGLNEVLQMQPVSFNWKNSNSPDTKLGLIAQELQTLIPEVVKSHTWETDEVTGELSKKELHRLGVYYSDLIPVLINAIKEQQVEIETLKTSQKNFETLLTRIEQLESKTSN